MSRLHYQPGKVCNCLQLHESSWFTMEAYQLVNLTKCKCFQKYEPLTLNIFIAFTRQATHSHLRSCSNKLAYHKILQYVLDKTHEGNLYSNWVDTQGQWGPQLIFTPALLVFKEIVHEKILLKKARLNFHIHYQTQLQNKAFHIAHMTMLSKLK